MNAELKRGGMALAGAVALWIAYLIGSRTGDTDSVTEALAMGALLLAIIGLGLVGAGLWERRTR
jgi:threonine/homoserine efflux transporter RhtA